MAGQAALLRLIAAGPAVRYQHLEPAAAVQAHPVAFGLLLVYWIAVAAAAVHVFRPLQWLGPARTVVVGAVMFGTAAALSKSPAQYLTESLLLFVAELMAVLNAVLVARSLAEPGAARVAGIAGRWLGSDDSAGDAADRWAWGPALFVFVMAALLAVVSYQRHPHIPDEVAFYLQARYFAHGQLWMAPPAVPAAFDLDLMAMEPSRWYSVMPPGWPAALAAGALLGVPWLVNPLLGAVNILLAYRLLLALYGRRTARLATLLLALSPWHTFLAMSYMSHTFSLTLALVAALGVARAWQGRSWWWCVAGGAGIGIASVNRPLEGVALALLLGACSLAARGRAFRFAPTAALVAGTFVAGLAGLAYNAAMTGHALTFPVEAYFKQVYGVGHYEIGFGPTRGLGWTGLDPLPGHGPVDVVINTLLNAFQVNTELLGWAAGSSGIVALALLARPWRGADALMAAAIAVIVGAHAFFWFSGGPDFGARYWFLAIVPAVALAARGIRWLEGEAAERQGRVLAAVGALSLAALLAFVPWRAADKYWHYRGMTPDGARAAQGSGRLVLVRGRRFPDFASAAVLNEVRPGASPRAVFAWARDDTTAIAAIRAFPGRSVWFLDGPSSTGGRWTVSRPSVVAR